jgi:hypothetical protein
MLMNARSLPLLKKYAVDPRTHRLIQRQVSEASFGVRCCQKSRELAARLNDRHGPGLLSGGRGLRPGLRLVDKVPKFLREARMSLARRLRRDLHRDGVESLVIAFRVTADERLNVILGRHLLDLGLYTSPVAFRAFFP